MYTYSVTNYIVLRTLYNVETPDNGFSFLMRSSRIRLSFSPIPVSVGGWDTHLTQMRTYSSPFRQSYCILVFLVEYFYFGLTTS